MGDIIMAGEPIENRVNILNPARKIPEAGIFGCGRVQRRGTINMPDQQVSSTWIIALVFTAVML
jgi:hypothetical protein